MSRLIAPFGLRMPPELRDKIEEAAKRNGRSMNAEVIARLSSTFEAEAGQQIDKAELERVVKKAVKDALKEER